MAKLQFSTKRLLIDQANATMVAMIAIASFVTIFSLVASKALLDQRAHQSRVIAVKEQAKRQLVSDLSQVGNLTAAYSAFVQAPQNAIGGSPSGQGDKDGDNALIVLDALPSQYDFPALATSIEKLLTNSNFKINSISGSDDEIAQSKNDTSANPVPVEMPFKIDVTSDYGSIQSLIGTFEHSIRPFYVQKLSFSGKDSSIELNMTAKTYYQPEKNLNITTKDIK